MSRSLDQHFFNETYFNFKSAGISSTTWNWGDLEKHHSDGLYFAGFLILPKKRIAFHLNDAIELK